MKTLLLIAMLLTGCSGFAQYTEDQIQRLWLSADTTALKVSYEVSKQQVIRSEPSLFEQQLILQRIQNQHEWDMEAIRMVSPRYYFVRIRE